MTDQELGIWKIIGLEMVQTIVSLEVVFASPGHTVALIGIFYTFATLKKNNRMFQNDFL